jgi:hypothetical protein
MAGDFNRVAAWGEIDGGVERARIVEGETLSDVLFHQQKGSDKGRELLNYRTLFPCGRLSESPELSIQTVYF